MPLFEFFLNDSLIANLYPEKKDIQIYKKIFNDSHVSQEEITQIILDLIHAYCSLGYDYATIRIPGFSFPNKEHEKGKTISLNAGSVIFDRESFEKYPWTDPEKADYALLSRLDERLPEGMKLIVWGLGGILENVISLVGYENLCYMVIDEPELAAEIFEAVGSRFVRFYKLCSSYNAVGAVISNDDWGFNSQAMLSIEDMRKYVFPWHQKVVEAIHASGKPAILHSCGNLANVMEDIIEVMKYDAKHSYEDKIVPVEEAYERWGDKITILGGIDLNFLIRAPKEEIYNRAAALVDKAKTKGGYALGSGNSIPDYVPDSNYFTMITAIHR